MADDYPGYTTETSAALTNIIRQRISSAKQIDEDNVTSAIELDSHADSAVVGRSARVLERTGRKVSVSGFTDGLGKPMLVEVVHACVLYDDEMDGRKYLCIIRNALYVPEMEECLVHPIMMRLVGIDVDECPKFLSREPTTSNHSIYFPERNLRIQMKLSGVISYIPCRKPDDDEITNNDGVLELTPDVDKWEPSKLELDVQEDAMLDFSGNIKEKKVKNFVLSSVMTRSMDPDLLANDMENKFGISSVKFSDGTSVMDPVELAQKWRISEKVARSTIAVTTRLCPRNSKDITLNRRYALNDRMLRYRHVPVIMYADTMHSTKRLGKSVRGFSCAQVFATSFGWVNVVLMKAEREAARAFKQQFREVCVPEKMVMDGARAQVRGDTQKECQLAGCQIVELERDTPSSNRAERTIGELKTGTKMDMSESKCPIVLWCYCLERRALICRSMAKDNFTLNGMTPHSYMTGETTDISNICAFDWYEWVKFRREGPDAKYPYPSERLGRCLGPATNKGNSMSQYVMMETGNVIPVQTLRSLTKAEMENPKEQSIMKAFDERIESRYGNHLKPPDNWKKRKRLPDDDELDDGPLWTADNTPELEDTVAFPYEEEGTKELEIPEADDIPDLDHLIGTEVVLPQSGTTMQTGKVIGRLLDKDGNPVGNYNKDPLLNTRVYEVLFPDGNVGQYSGNLIAESIYMDCDEEGRRSQMMESIVEVRSNDDALQKSEGFIVSANGERKRVKTTKGWSVLIQWKDGQRSWLPMKDVKESYPIELAEFVSENGMIDEPAFHWWAPYVLKKKVNIVSAVKQRVAKKSHKFGIEVPRSVEHALRLDRENNNTFWRDAIAKEMLNVRPAFKVLEDDENTPVGFTKLSVHMIFDVKMDLTRKARLVADGHKTPDPELSTYAGVVSRESVRIGLTYAALMGINIWGADIQNAFISAPTTEKFYIICGDEFGSELKGRRAIIKRALYGMKSAASDFRNHLRDCMSHLGYQPCRADADLWMRLAKLDNGTDYYEYILLYVDDCLVISANPEESLNRLGKYFSLKKGSVGPPDLYLGAKITKVGLPNGVNAWAWSPSKYIQEAISNLEKELNRRGLKLKRGVNSPLQREYRPECDLTPECNDEDARLYMSLIGVLRWMVELGRIDLTCEVSMMASHSAMPREGHLQQLLQIFGYLKNYHNSRLVFDPTYPDIDPDQFPKKDWSQFYGKQVEEIPEDCPKPLGSEFLIRAYVDADFAGEKLTRRSRTGYIIMLNNSPIYWYSKKQSACETSSFGSEFLALKTCCEYLRGLRLKLRQMGIPVSYPCFIFGDNQSVLWNCTVPESMLKKKTSSVAYHFVREGVSRDEWRITYVKTDANPADLCTKSLPAGSNRKRKVRAILYDIYPDDVPDEDL